MFWVLRKKYTLLSHIARLKNSFVWIGKKKNSWLCAYNRWENHFIYRWWDCFSLYLQGNLSVISTAQSIFIHISVTYLFEWFVWKKGIRKRIIWYQLFCSNHGNTTCCHFPAGFPNCCVFPKIRECLKKQWQRKCHYTQIFRDQSKW